MLVLARSAGSRGSNDGVPTVTMADGVIAMDAPIGLVFQVDGTATTRDGGGTERMTSERSNDDDSREIPQEGEELFALSCPLRLGMSLGVEPAVEPPPSFESGGSGGHKGGLLGDNNGHRRRLAASGAAAAASALFPTSATKATTGAFPYNP